MGSRKPILFCEGERGGLDHIVYQLCYPDHHVIPRGGSEKVIEAVKALSANAGLHTVKASGLVDRDVRTEGEIDALAAQGVNVIQFAEVENLLCNESLVKAIAEVLSLDPQVTLSAVTDFVINAFTGELEAQIVLHAARRMRYHLSCYSPVTNDRTGLTAGVTKLLSTLDIEALVAQSESTLQQAIAGGKLDAVLRVYNRKSMADRIAGCLGLKQGEYKALVLRMLKNDQSHRYRALIQQYLPAL